ncbi:MAG: 3-oxoacyl-(acyl-carrier-protein)-like protein [Myxococcaceae bacterium]|nr:3-oxoacyl-(acyl-carrier-protein)-like protein [Myxococcaceae bacterium]
MTGIVHLDYALPEHALEVEELFALAGRTIPEGQTLETYAADYRRSFGIERVLVEERRDELEMLTPLLERFFAERHATPAEIDLLICNVDSNRKCDSYDPYAVLASLQRRFGMEKSVVFAVGQACSSTLFASRLADSLFTTGEYQNALYLSTSRVTRNDQRDIGVTLLSDGVGLLYLHRDATKLRLVDTISATHGCYEQATIDPMRVDVTAKMKVIQSGAKTVRDILVRNGLTVRDLVVMVPQNLNVGGWNTYARLLELDLDIVKLDNVKDGHIGDVDIIRNLADRQRERPLASGENALLYSSGWGTSWNSALLRGG